MKTSNMIGAGALVLAAALALLWGMSYSGSESAVGTAEPAVTEAPGVRAAVEATVTAVTGRQTLTAVAVARAATPTAVPATAVPTTVPESTATESATADTAATPAGSSTPIPEPVTIQGTGAAIVDVDLWPGDALVSYRISEGDHYFVIDGFDDDGKETWAGPATSGDAKEGDTLMTYTGSATTRIQVDGDRDWELTFYPFEPYVRYEPVPGTISGQGREMVMFILPEGQRPDVARIYKDDDDDWFGFSVIVLVPGEIPGTVARGRTCTNGFDGPLEVVLPANAIGLFGVSEGPWHIEVDVR